MLPVIEPIMNAIAETKTYIESVNARTTDHRTALINLVVTIHDVDHMHDIMRRLRRVDGVVEVQRARPT